MLLDVTPTVGRDQRHLTGGARAAMAWGCDYARVEISAVRDARVFSAAERDYSWADVIVAARGWGEWQALEQRTRGLIARERRALAADEAPSRAEVTAAANAFRQQRRLLASDEIRQWLARWGITVQEWMGHIRRSLIAESTSAEARGEADPEVEGDLGAAVWVDAVCSGSLAAFATRLAERVAVQVRLADGGDSSPTIEELVARGDEIRTFCDRQVTDAALAEEVSTNLIGWMRIDCRYLVNGEVPVLREAALCVSEDGRGIADVATQAGLRLHTGRFYLDDVEPALRARLLAASPGELVGPVAMGGGEHWLLFVDDRVPASVGDGVLRERARERIIERAISAEVSRSVRWHERL
jgi:hypothetical protein